jgi:V/A-type H+-transporting ATPase subunit C
MSRLDFANARIGARRTRLLGGAEIRELLARPDLSARLELLGRLGLVPPEPARLLEEPDPLGAAEAELRAGVRREGLRVLADAEGRRARALLAAFLEIEAPRAVRAVLRGIVAGVPLDEVVALAPPTPELPAERIRELSASGTVEQVAERLAAWGSPLGPALRAALPLRGERGLLPAEIALDRAAFARASEACRAAREDARVLRAHLRDRIDVRNGETLLVLSGAPAAPELFLPGGRRIGVAAFLRLARLPPEELRAGLGGLLRLGEGGLETPWAADRTLERAALAPLRREARARPLSLAVPLAWLAERRAEARAVAVALRGAELGLPAEEILDLAEA